MSGRGGRLGKIALGLEAELGFRGPIDVEKLIAAGAFDIKNFLPPEPIPAGQWVGLGAGGYYGGVVSAAVAADTDFLVRTTEGRIGYIRAVHASIVVNAGTAELSVLVQDEGGTTIAVLGRINRTAVGGTFDLCCGLYLPERWRFTITLDVQAASNADVRIGVHAWQHRVGVWPCC